VEMLCPILFVAYAKKPLKNL